MTAYQSFPHSRPLRVLLAAAVVVGLAACSSVNSSLNMEHFGLYKPEVVQGNFVSREQRQALRLGMARAQVKDILGTPLVSSLFHVDRWDYVFTIRRQGVAPQNFKLSVHFKADALSQIDSDELPSENEFVQRLVGDKKISQPPLLQASEEDLRKFPPAKASSPAPVSPLPPLPASYPPLEPAAR
jgi:outer membrane protein assembly factor BamE